MNEVLRIYFILNTFTYLKISDIYAKLCVCLFHVHRLMLVTNKQVQKEKHFKNAAGAVTNSYT